MPEYISITATEGLPAPIDSDGCGIRIRGVASLAYNNAALPVNIRTLEGLASQRENDLMSLQGSLGALRVCPSHCPPISFYGAQDNFSGHDLESMPISQTSYMGLFAHHDIRFVLTPRVRIVLEDPFTTEDRAVATTLSFTQFDFKKDNYQEIQVTSKCKSFNFRVEPSATPTLMKDIHWLNYLHCHGIKASLSVRRFVANADVNVAYIFPNADEDDTEFPINRDVIDAFERPDVFGTFNDYNSYDCKVTAV